MKLRAEGTGLASTRPGQERIGQGSMTYHRVWEANHEPHPGSVGDKPMDRERRAFGRQGVLHRNSWERLLFLLLPAIWFFYQSWRPRFGLRAEMPPQFVDVQAANTPAEWASEEKLAHQYWAVARVIRWRFTYGSPLPANRPPQFRIEERAASASVRTQAAKSEAERNGREIWRMEAGSSDSSIRYWRKLRSAWLQPDSWEVHREWSTTWFTGALVRGYAGFQVYISNLVRIN